jgi:hypothetical protein
MIQSRPSAFLRFALVADAIASGATGLAMALFSGALSALLNLPAPLLFYAGLILVPYAAAIAYLSRRKVLPRWAVFAVIVCNVLWAVDSVILAFSGWVAPSALGYAFILMQALVVFAFAEMQYVGLRRSSPAAAAQART